MDSFCSQAYTSKGLTAVKNQRGRGALFTYILKGHPTEIKNKFIFEAQNSANCECDIDYDYNENPISLVCEGKGFCIVDGTYPCIREPETYGITDKIISLGEYQSGEILKFRKDEALRLFDEIKKEEKRCAGFISAARSVAADCRHFEENSLNRAKINRFAAKLWKKYGTPPTGRIGTERKYFGEVITENGLQFSFEKFSRLCSNISVINDFSSAAGALIVDKIRLYALSSGYDVISFIDFLDGCTLRHVAVPELGYGIYCERTLKAEFENAGRIRKSRFLKEDYTENLKNRASFCKKAYSELVEEAVKSLRFLEKSKGNLNKIYLSATDEAHFFKKNVISA